MKYRNIALLSAILLGWFGFHRFYVNQIGLGILYLVFFWTGIPFITSFVDAIVWTTWSEEKWNLQFNQNNDSQTRVVTKPIVAESIRPGSIFTYEMPYYVHGLKHHAYEQVRHIIKQGIDVQLVAEPDNTFDDNAVKVLLGDKQLGYVAAKDALNISCDLGLYDHYRTYIKYYDPAEKRVDERISLSIKFWDNEDVTTLNNN